LFLRSPKTPVFVLGCQRSGTTICLEIFERSKRYSVFHEGNKRAMADKCCLRPIADIQFLIDRERARFLIFKPLNDTQYADKILDEISPAKIIWIYRNFFDTANSAVAKWGSDQRDMVTWIGRNCAKTGRFEEVIPPPPNGKTYALYADRMSEPVTRRLIEWTREPISEHTGAAIFWYIRNRLFFDLRLSNDKRVLPLCYERFATYPDQEIKRICDFIGARYQRKLSRRVRASSIGKHVPPSIASSVRQACQELTIELDNAEVLRRSHTRAAPAS